jgi:hypothetical protein
MKRMILLTIIATLGGCVTTKPVVPELAGKPRLKINDQESIPTVAEPPNAVLAPAPVAKNTKDSKGSKKNVRKTNNTGNAQH